MICAIPVGSLKPASIFITNLGDEQHPNLVVGCVERVPSGKGYAQVTLLSVGDTGKHHKFKDKDGEEHEFTDSGFRRSEWSAGTLVRPLVEEKDMSETTDVSLVEAAGAPAASVSDIRKKVAKMKAKASTLAKAPAKAPASKAKAEATPKAPAAKGKPAAKAAPKAKASTEKNNSCKCACGGKTGGSFVPGHDARYYGWLQRIVDGRMQFTELPKAVQRDLGNAAAAKKALQAHKK